MKPVRKPGLFILNAFSLLLFIRCAHAQETIDAIRHAEKHPASLGQITARA